MGTQATLVYRVVALGTTVAKLQPFVASAPIPPEILQAFGLRVISDNTPVANPIVRTIVLSFDPSAAALVIPPVISNTGRFQEVFVDVANSGRDYILPPIIRANNNARTLPLVDVVEGNQIIQRPVGADAIFKAYMAVYAAEILTPGSGYTLATTTVTFLGGLPPANFNFDFREVDPTTETSIPRNFRGGCVRYINIADPGEGYDPATVQLNIQGGGPNGNTPAIPAQGILVLDAAGRVRSITITDMGSQYVATPDVVLTTTTGIAPRKPAKLYAVMAEGRPARGTVIVGAGPGFPITGITITDFGDNYVTVPEIRIFDSGAGVGATARARMGLGRIDTIDPGEFYLQGTTLAITPGFQEFFPTIAGSPQAQAAMFFKLLEGAISQLAITPLASDTPLVA
jgi:hypothetical protein